MNENSTYNQLLLKNNTVFTITELNQIWSSLSRDVLYEKLNYLVKTNKLNRLKRGVYSIPDREINPFELGNKIVTPSYVSFYSVLFQKSVIFQFQNSIYLASRNSSEITINNTTYIYKKLDDSILLNKNGIQDKDNYKIASKERAYLDTLYLNPGIGFDNEEILDKEKCLQLVEIYNNKRLTKEVKERLNT